MEKGVFGSGNTFVLGHVRTTVLKPSAGITGQQQRVHAE